MGSAGEAHSIDRPPLLRSNNLASNWGETDESASDDEPLSSNLRMAALKSWGSAERSWRAWSGWLAVVAVSKLYEVARMRVRWMIERNIARRTLCEWSELVDLKAERSASAERVARRHRRMCSACAVAAWRHVVYWRVQWRVISPSIARRWSACLLRGIICNWSATVVRLKRLNAAADNFRRRRNYILCAGTVSRYVCTSVLLPP